MSKGFSVEAIQPFRAFLLVFLAGGLGSVARFALSTAVMDRLGLNIASGGFPYGTLTVNLLGCLAVGLFLGQPSSIISGNPTLRLVCITGFLGGFTTFSAYEAESFQLILQGEFLKAGVNLLGSVALGLAGVALGMALSRFFLFRVQ
jgi:fluoride exporter